MRKSSIQGYFLCDWGKIAMSQGDFDRVPADVRYQRDATFHTVVDMLRAALERYDFTPTELREAVILAASMHEMGIIRPLVMRVFVKDLSKPERKEGV